MRKLVSFIATSAILLNSVLAPMSVLAQEAPLIECNGSSFDELNLGSVNGQGGWSSTGSYDQAIVSNSYGFSSFGCKTLRLSNAVTTGSFGDQTFSFSTSNQAGETTATNNGYSGGAMQNHFEAQFDIASTQQTPQPGLIISVSPDRGDGSRMSYLRFEDGSNGINVFFDDVQGVSNPASFVETQIAKELTRTPHTIKFVIDFVDGPSNDIVKIYIDNSLVHTGTTWENYYRFDTEASAEQGPRTTDNLLFRAGGNPVPENRGNGFLFDNISLSSSIISSDTTPPSIPVLEWPGNGSFINDNTPLMQWADSVDEQSGVKNYDYQVFYNCSNPANIPSSCVGHYGPVISIPSQLQAGATADGVYYWQVQARDNADNVSGWSAPWKVTIDTQAPTIPILISPNDGALVTGNPVQSWTPVPSAHHYLYASYYDEEATRPIFSTPVSGTSRSVGGMQTITIYWRVKAVDTAGNESGWSDMRKLIIDNTKPTTPLITGFLNPSLSCGAITNTKTVTVDWSDSTDENRVAGYNYSINYPLPSGTGRGEWNTFFTTSQYGGTLNEGIHHIKVNAKDAAGNVSLWSNICDITYDSIAPDVEITSPTSTLIKGTVPIRGKVSDANPHHYWLVIQNSDGQTVAGPGTVNSSTSFEDKLFFNWDTTKVPDGNYTIKLEARDAANNKDSGSVDWNSVVVDNNAPTGNWVTPTDGSIISGGVPLQFNAIDNVSGVNTIKYFYSSDSATFLPISSPWDTTGLTLGNYTLRAEVTDYAGNTANFDITVGIAAVISNQSSTTPTETTAVITWTTDRPTTSRVVYDIVPHYGLGSAPNYGYAYSTAADPNHVTSHSVTISGLLAGTTYFFRVISEGSPTAVGGESYFQTLSYAGPPMSSWTGSGTVLGLSTSLLPTQSVSNKLALAYEDQPTENKLEEVLGASTDNSDQNTTQSPTPKTATKETVSSKNIWKIIIGAGVIILLTIYSFYKLNKKGNKQI